jgi:hypothetical protein
MDTINPFPEGSYPPYVEVLHCEPLGEQRLALMVATRQVTASLSGWAFQAAHLTFRGYQGHQVHARPAPTGVQQDGSDRPVKRYIIAAREGMWKIIATGCERQPLEAAHVEALADVYAQRTGIGRGTLFVPSPVLPALAEGEVRR